MQRRARLAYATIFLCATLYAGCNAILGFDDAEFRDVTDGGDAAGTESGSDAPDAFVDSTRDDTSIDSVTEEAADTIAEETSGTEDTREDSAAVDSSVDVAETLFDSVGDGDPTDGEDTARDDADAADDSIDGDAVTDSIDATTDAVTDSIDSGDACPGPVAKSGFKFVFVTSNLFYSNLGGLDGADAKCNAAARAACLPGSYVAWLSTLKDLAFTHAKTRVGNGPWQLVTGPTVANSQADLIDGVLLAPINRTEFGTSPTSVKSCTADFTPNVWTNTTAEGIHNSLGTDCNDWRGAGNTDKAATGHAQASASAAWTSYCSTTCDQQAHLYCFQQ